MGNYPSVAPHSKLDFNQRSNQGAGFGTIPVGRDFDLAFPDARRFHFRRLIADSLRHRLAVAGEDQFLAPLDLRNKTRKDIPGFAQMTCMTGLSLSHQSIGPDYCLADSPKRQNAVESGLLVVLRIVVAQSDAERRQPAKCFAVRRQVQSLASQ